MLTADTVLALLRSTIFHPVASLVLPGSLVLLDTEKSVVRAAGSRDARQVVRSVSPRLLAALCCVGLSWTLQLNRALNRIALDPAKAGTYNWKEEVVVVTGGSSGVGASLVRKLDSLGCTVCVLDVMPLASKPGPRTYFFKCDITSLDNVQDARAKIIEKLGGKKPTILVANAGVVRGRSLLDASEADIRLTFDVNVIGVFWSIKAFLPDMVAANHGHILLTSSIAAFTTLASTVDYCASKAAVTSIYEGLQTELKHRYGNPRVQCSAVFPGTINTNMFQGIDSPMKNFLLPVLEPDEVSERMFRIIKEGRSQSAVFPSFANTHPLGRVLPAWVRVGAQDSGANVMANLRVAKGKN